MLNGQLYSFSVVSLCPRANAIKDGKNGCGQILKRGTFCEKEAKEWKEKTEERNKGVEICVIRQSIGRQSLYRWHNTNKKVIKILSSYQSHIQYIRLQIYPNGLYRINYFQ